MQENGTERRRSTWRPIALATVAGAVLVAMGVGVWATLSATASNAASPEQVTTGTLSLTMAAAPTTAGGSTAGAGFSQAIGNLAPGDSVNRYVDLTNGGSLDAQAVTLAVAANGPRSWSPTARPPARCGSASPSARPLGPSRPPPAAARPAPCSRRPR